MTIWQDVRFGARTLRKSTGFALAAVLTLTLGIGVTTAVFSVCDAMLWKPVPLPHLESLVMVLGRVPEDPNDWNAVTPGDLDDIRRESTTLESIAVWQGGSVNIAGGSGQPDRVSRYRVSANFFDVMGVQPVLGRGFQPGEDQPGRDRVAVIGNALWRTRFAADPAIAGKSVRLDDADYTIAGVMPPKFEFPLPAQVWTPLALQPGERLDRTNRAVIPAARLKPGRSIAEAAAELDAIGARLAARYPDTNRNRRFMVMGSHYFFIGSYSYQYSLMIFGAVLFVLLIACVNVANLQFARAFGRMREIAVRTALGAGRVRVIRQLVTESLMLALAGGALSLLVASWGIDLIRAGMPAGVEKYVLGWKEIGLDGRTLAFAFAMAVITGVLAGLAPAWQSSRPDLNDTLKQGGRGASAGRGHHRLRSVLVGGEIALAVVLLVGASLMVRGFHRLMTRDAHLEPASLLTLRVAITASKYPQSYRQAAFYHGVLERVSRVPGVESAAAASAIPHSQQSWSTLFTIEGAAQPAGFQPEAQYQAVSPNYFGTMHIPLRAGRLLTDRDGPDSPRVAVISGRMAELWWPGQPAPLGKRIKLGGPEAEGPWIRVVGIVGDVMHSSYDRAPRATLYVSYEQAPRLSMDIGVRAAGRMAAATLASAVIAAIHSVDPEQPATDVCILDTLMHNEVTGLDYVTVLMGIFGLLALVLAAVGVYGVMAYLVSAQTHDIGIRMALGASRQSVLEMVFRRGMLTAAIGLSAGLAASWLLARLMASLIWGVTAGDPATFTGIPLALLVAAGLAIYIPARRAMRIDPIVALRYE